MQRSRPLPPGMHGKNGMRTNEEKIVGGMHEGSHRVGSLPCGAECVLQLQTFAVEYEDAYKGRATVLDDHRLLDL